MDSKAFFDLVEQMRKAQNLYFRSRTTEALRAAQKIEGQVDAEIKRVHDLLNGGQYKMKNMFGDECSNNTDTGRPAAE